MALLDTLRYRLTLDTGNLKQGVKATRADLSKLDRNFKQTAGSSNRLSSSMGGLTRTFAGLVTVAGAWKSLKIADDFQRFRIRIRRVTRDTNLFEKSFKALKQTAYETGTNLKTSVGLFEALALTKQDLQATNDELLAVTDTITKIGVIGGSSVERMNNAITQLGQAFAGGVVRAEEWNSIVENTPQLAVRIARAMGTTAGQLRKKVIEGLVTSKEVFDALLSIHKDVSLEFAAMPLTVEIAMGRIKNAWGEFVAGIDEGLQATPKFAKQLDSIAKRIRNTGAVIGDILVKSGGDWGKVLRGLSDEFEWFNLVVGGASFLVFRKLLKFVTALITEFAILVSRVKDIAIKMASLTTSTIAYTRALPPQVQGILLVAGALAVLISKSETAKRKLGEFRDALRETEPKGILGVSVSEEAQKITDSLKPPKIETGKGQTDYLAIEKALYWEPQKPPTEVTDPLKERQAMLMTLKEIVKRWQDVAQSLKDVLKPFVEMIDSEDNPFSESVSGFIKAVDKFASKVLSVLSWFQSLIGLFYNINTLFMPLPRFGEGGGLRGFGKGGDRASGGSVLAGGIYEVGEQGTELLREGGRNYLLPSRDGFVVPNERLQGGGVNITINDFRQKGREVQVEEAGNDITIIIEDAVDTAIMRGRYDRVLSRRYGI